MLIYFRSKKLVYCFKHKSTYQKPKLLSVLASNGTFGKGRFVRLFSLTPYVSDFSCFFRCLPMLRYLFFYSSVCFLCVFVSGANLSSPNPNRVFSAFSSDCSLMFVVCFCQMFVCLCILLSSRCSVHIDRYLYVSLSVNEVTCFHCYKHCDTPQWCCYGMTSHSKVKDHCW